MLLWEQMQESEEQLELHSWTFSLQLGEDGVCSEDLIPPGLEVKKKINCIASISEYKALQKHIM